jgi:hypothetical protein
MQSTTMNSYVIGVHRPGWSPGATHYQQDVYSTGSLPLCSSSPFRGGGRGERSKLAAPEPLPLTRLPEAGRGEPDAGGDLLPFGLRRPPLLIRYGRIETLSGPGKSAGTGWVTFPVAAHSTPRANVVRNPTHFIAGSACPRVVWNTRPFS